MIIDTAGNLYGTTREYGGVFKLMPNADRTAWKLRVLYKFCSQQNCTDGNISDAGLAYAGEISGALYDAVSPLYGTTFEGGAHNQGVVFQLQPAKKLWKETVIYNFCSQAARRAPMGRNR